MTQGSNCARAVVPCDQTVAKILRALDLSRDPIILFDEQWRYEYVNEAACTLLNRSASELLGHECWELFPELRHSENAQALRRLMREREPATRTYRSAFKGALLEGHAYTLAGGGLAVIVHSIDAHVRTERAHYESERRFRALADLVPCVIWTADPKGRPIWVNQRWLDYIGTTLEATQTSPLEALHPDDRERWNAEYRAATRSKELHTFEFQLRHHDGTCRWHLAQTRPILDEAGEIAYWLGSATDIQAERDMLFSERSARREAEQMRQSLARVLEQAPFAVAITAGSDHVFKSANVLQMRLFGHRPTVNLPARLAFPEKELEPVHDLFDRAFRENQAVVLREQRVGWDRTGKGQIEYGYFDLVYQPILDENGSVEGLLCVSTDVSESVEARLSVSRSRSEAEAARGALERAHAELELRIAERTAELERSNAALATEIATRNDLQRRLSSAREDEQRRTARDLHDQVGQTLSALTLTIKAACEADTLPPAALSRLNDALQLAGRLGRDIHDLATRLRPAVLDAFGLHAALRQLLTDWSHHSGIEVDFEATWLKSKRLASDIETTLYRVAQEALTNVARHAHATRATVVVELHDGRVIEIVEDNGCGFDADSVALGRMGLEGMRERVMLVGGTFDIESAPGAGTTIFVSIPITEVA